MYAIVSSARRARIQPRLLDGPVQPYAPQLEGHLLMGERSAGIGIGDTSRRGLQDIQVVQDVVQTAIVGKPIQKGPNGIFGGHDTHLAGAGGPKNDQ